MRVGASGATAQRIRRFRVVALQVPIFFNSDGDHDHNGLIFALERNKAELETLKDPAAVGYGKPHPLVRPLVLRARAGDTVEIHFRNHVRGRRVGIHLIADGYDVRQSDGAHVGINPSSLAAPPGTTGDSRTYVWHCRHEGVFPFHDAGDLSGGEDGTNVHGLFGALVVEPPEATWTDPVDGTRLDGPHPDGFAQGDGLCMDVHPRGTAKAPAAPFRTPPPMYPSPKASFREFAVFFHDEAEYMPAHETPEPNPCPARGGHGGRRDGCCCGGCGGGGRPGGHDLHGGDLHHPGDHHHHRHHASQGACGRHGSGPHDDGSCRRVDHRSRGPGPDHTGGHGHGGSEHEGELPIMTISYRAEPMINRERKLWRMIREGSLLEPVIGEEQHHSSWLFGEPATPVLCAYVGDPIRIRFVHAAVKETHVFHQHVYQWHADPGNRNSPIVDSITVGPQTGHTIEYLYGAGSAQGAVGDAIFHCHLYPHFHEGMWGITRTFDRLQTGRALSNPIEAKTYPDGSPLLALQPLPDREPPPSPTPARPGYPFFIPGQVGQKSPIPPWPAALGAMPPELDYRPPGLVTPLEAGHLNSDPQPGALFNLFPFDRDGKGQKREVQSRAIDVIAAPVVYNSDGWHDPHGHLFVLAEDAERVLRGGEQRPLVVRGHRDTVVQTTLHNRLPATIPGTAFDLPFPPCDFFPTPLAECGLHVHLVKFDPLVSDGASVGWNYLSGPRTGKEMVYRWHVDEEFGTVFFHDHLFANYRQKHGLFGAFIAEPPNAEFLDPRDLSRGIASGVEAVIKVPRSWGCTTYFREFAVAVADFVPLFDGHGDPLNPPEQAGGHSDQGVMAVNYRCEPIVERGGDPAFWFLSRHHQYEVSDPDRVTPRRTADVRHGDPDTDVFEAHAGDPVRIRLFQGSHEEQHSFQVHGMRWRQYANDVPLPGSDRLDVTPPISAWRNQQTVGISEAFTFALDQRYSRGDHLWKFSAADDLWLGCWGLVRVLERGDDRLPALPLGKTEEALAAAAGTPPEPPTKPTDMWRYHVVARYRPVVYRERDLIDPRGVVYELSAYAPKGQAVPTVVPQPSSAVLHPDHRPVEPLVIRCRQGDWVQVTLENRLPNDLAPEPFAPQVPVEDCGRRVSSRVSMHADLLRYDVRTSDGANVGDNPVQSAEPGAAANTVTYSWHADEDVGVALLQDMADFRNHRHHGAVGALVVEPKGAQATTWHRPRATITVPGATKGTASRTYEEFVLILQDGLRLFFHGNESFPVPDVPDLQDDPRGDTPDVEDQGQKGFNYRSEPTGRPWWLDLDEPATPLISVPPESWVWFRLVGGADKPRNHSFTIHGHTWVTNHISEAGRRVGAVSGVTSGWAETFHFQAARLPVGAQRADYAYRSGVLKWDVVQGLWGIMRVEPPGWTLPGAAAPVLPVAHRPWRDLVRELMLRAIGRGRGRR
ncbi:multicopper oxidase domain-containing protein [Geodermatophilus sp. SYSU D00758]